tara:strand:- start:6767 stop:7198 length:432 start_codon:yes stop_codon:yes gene_type:complete
MKRYIEYNISDGSINALRIIHEEDISLYSSDTVSFYDIGTSLVDIRNSYFVLSSSEIKELQTLPIQYNTLSYEISSSNSISFSSIPVNTQFELEYNSNIIESASSIDDGILTFTTDTVGVYTLEFSNSLYNNLSSTTYSITAL